MEAYPPDYVQLNLPLVLLSGLGERADASPPSSPEPRQESGTRVVTASAQCTGDRAAPLLHHLLKHDGTTQAWNATAMPGPPGALKYRIKAIGRTFTLPPRKAAPLPQSPSAQSFQSQHRGAELHSPLSPLSPGSPIYPDGVFTPLWIAKHQRHVPALLLAFFNITADDGTAQNEQIQMDINATRLALGRSGYKTRFAAVLISDRSILHAPELEDRLSAIRRATTLDPKTGLFFMPPMSSQVEIATFVAGVLAPLQPAVLEYYRDLAKHARRKKTRGGPVVASGAAPTERGAHSLATPGWNARYEVKQAVFAEFRQEMDVAERHYSAAIEELCSAEGILEATPSWSPRWSEARLLCDALALRTLRCQLWSGLTTGAAVSWLNYRDRMRGLVDRRRNGTQTYGWEAWECRWAEIMARLIQRAALAVLQPPARSADELPAELLARTAVFAPLEKGGGAGASASAGERLPPFQLLHHAGYWLRMAFCSARARRGRALAIPEEDRGVSAARSGSYDTYLVPEPREEYPSGEGEGYDHLAQLHRLASDAIGEFEARGQLRSAERLRFELAQQFADAGCYARALETGVPLWNEVTWRDEDWEHLFAPLVALVHDCAARVGDGGVLLATAWELLGTGSLPSALRELGLAEYFARGRDGGERVVVGIENGERVGPVAVTCTFVDRETHVGELVECQLVLSSRAVAPAALVTLSRVEIVLSNSTKVTIHHQPSASAITGVETLLDLSEATASEDGSLDLKADLALLPAQKRVCSFYLTFRAAGAVRVRHATLIIDTSGFALQHTYTDEDLMRAKAVYTAHGDALEQRVLPHLDTTAVTVLPKPPKMLLALHGLGGSFYVDERVRLTVELANGEVEGVDATAVLRVLGGADDAVVVGWCGAHAEGNELVIGKLGAATTYKADLTVVAPSLPCSYTLEIEVRYTLDSEAATPLVKTLAVEMEVAVPFEAKHTFGPAVEPGAWPSYFDASGAGDAGAAEGIPQRWRMGSLLSSASVKELVVRGVELVIESVGDEATCDLVDAAPREATALGVGESTQLDFEFVTRKSSLDDRGATDVGLALLVTWARRVGSGVVTTRLAVPRLTLPSSEPRVLLCRGEDTTAAGVDDDDRMVGLHYHLENPSMHFLTFALTMEANDAFAFAGAKNRTLSLAPLSRVRVEYGLLVHERGEAEARGGLAEGGWVWPVLQVVDSYYRKNLRVQAGGVGVRGDEKGGLGVWVGGGR
ncbi:hypothetical protein LTR08_008986 [Meristemomyces frigidus]|nr:hypothetical protein LTR08_008986 [Meristemomyces frigidus]